MKAPEKLLARLINYLAEKYKNQLILKGGMLLRLLNSPRETQDLDYAWIRKKKRNIFAQELKSTLEQLDGIKVTDVATNSRGIFLEISDQRTDQKAKIEINVVTAIHLPPKPMTTASLANPFSLKAQIVSTMDLSEAFSHKIAAALERDLMRDLYDLMQMEPLTSFDEKTLKDRLSELEINRAKPKLVSMKEAAHRLKLKLDALTGKKIKEELSASMPNEQLVGLDIIIRASISRIIQRLEAMENS